MKDQLSVIITAAALAFLAVRIYQKYIKKNQGTTGSTTSKTGTFSSSSKDDDYEPYSKK